MKHSISTKSNYSVNMCMWVCMCVRCVVIHIAIHYKPHRAFKQPVHSYSARSQSAPTMCWFSLMLSHVFLLARHNKWATWSLYIGHIGFIGGFKYVHENMFSVVHKLCVWVWVCVCTQAFELPDAISSRHFNFAWVIVQNKCVRIHIGMCIDTLIHWNVCQSSEREEAKWESGELKWKPTEPNTKKIHQIFPYMCINKNWCRQQIPLMLILARTHASHFIHVSSAQHLH